VHLEIFDRVRNYCLSRAHNSIAISGTLHWLARVIDILCCSQENIAEARPRLHHSHGAVNVISHRALPVVFPWIANSAGDLSHARTSPTRHAVTPADTFIGAGNSPVPTFLQSVLAEKGTSLNAIRVARRINASSDRPSKSKLEVALHGVA